MYHPAAALYNPGLKSTVKKDFVRLKEFVDNGCKLEEDTKEKSFDDEKQEIVDDILNL
jgi:hypothetical protein